MGFYDATCSISGLPIVMGDRVRAILLTQTPYVREDGIPSYWFPRSFPIRATYSGYGTIKDGGPGPARDLWLECLAHDIVPMPQGPNRFHDVATSRDMPWNDMLVALRERRIQVRAPKSTEKVLLGSGIPTLKRVRARLDSQPEGLILSLERRGTVRVVWGGAKNAFNHLVRAKRCLRRYACVIKPGAAGPELWVHARPGAKTVVMEGPHNTPLAHLWQVQYSGVVNAAFDVLGQ